jgi:hypothetical protein
MNIANENGIATLQGLEGVFGNVLTAALALAGIGLFIMLLVGGFKYITSGGDEKSMGSARNTITYAILGIVLVALAYLILRFIETFTGVEGILNFQVYQP